MTVSFILNGEDVSLRVRTVDRLVDLLRDHFKLMGLRADCRRGLCGACLAFVDGRLTPTCLVPAFAAAGKEIVTIEGFRGTEEYADLAAAFDEAGVEDCGFCRNAKLLAAAALLERNGRPDGAAIAEGMSVVRCRCTDHAQIERAVLAAADRRSRRLYHRGR
jgi:carbon-monoxide dehydrogenase small subunit